MCNRTVLAAFLVTALARASSAQSLAYALGAEALNNDDFGRAVAKAGDVDGDGFADIAVGAPFDDHNGTNAGAVRVYSGKTGALLRTWYGEQSDSLFGWSVDGLGDIDGDGKSDVIVGAPLFDPASNQQNAGEALVLSGVDGFVLWRQFVLQPGAQVGDEVRGLGDVNGDGRGDYALGVSHYDTASFTDAGRVALYSGATHALIGGHNGTSAGELFGCAIDIVQAGPTLGATRIAVGSLAFGANDNGRAYVVDGNANLLMWSDGAFSGGQAGTAVAGVGDLDGDGVNDVAIGEPYADVGGTDTGRVFVVSVGTSPHPVLRIYTGSTSNSYFGSELANIGDYDGDGVDDLLVGMPLADPSGSTDAGRAVVISCATGAELATWSGGFGDHFGREVDAAGDLNHDGAMDFVIGAPDAPMGAGRAYVYLSNAPQPAGYCTAKTNSLGCVPAVNYSGVASLSIADNFRVLASGVLNQKNGMLFWGHSAAASPFLGATLCVHQPLRRTPVQSSGGSASGSDCTGTFQYSFSHAYMQANGIAAGDTLHAQFWSRDPGFATPLNFSLTSALAFDVAH